MMRELGRSICSTRPRSWADRRQRSEQPGKYIAQSACQSADFRLVYELIQDHKASASVANNYGEESTHPLHEIPSETPEFIETIAVLLDRAVADVEC
jgi:hypothetical protein